MAQAKKKTTIRRRRERKNIEQGQVHIQVPLQKLQLS